MFVVGEISEVITILFDQCDYLLFQSYGGYRNNLEQQIVPDSMRYRYQFSPKAQSPT